MGQNPKWLISRNHLVAAAPGTGGMPGPWPSAREALASWAMLLVISILLEGAIAVIAVLAARQGRPYIYGLAFTFLAYVIYDIARFMHWPVEGPLLSGLFLIATIAALIAVWGLYRDRPSK
jgi:uncharacterized membrane protein HdeD (DUF308 family)